MKISVIVPFYQAEATLLRCVTSIEKALEKVNTRYQMQGEVILVNDGSLDHSFAMCKALAKKYNNIQCVSQKRKGMAAAKNAGLLAASGEFVCFIDALDIVEEKFFIHLFQEMKTDTALVFTRPLHGNKQKLLREKEERLHVIETPWLAMEALLTGNELALVYGKLFRRAFIPAGFQEAMEPLEDMCFLADYLCCQKGNIKEIPQREYLLMEEHEELSLDRVDMLEKAYQYVQEKMQEVGARELYSLQMKYLHHFVRNFLQLPQEELESERGKEVLNRFKLRAKRIAGSFHLGVIDRALYIGLFISPEVVGNIAKIIS